MMTITTIFAIPLILIPLVMTLLRFHRFITQREQTRQVRVGDSDILDLSELPAQGIVTVKERRFSYPEILFIGIAPPLGIIFTYIFHKELPIFELKSTPSLAVWVVLGYASYWVSKLYKKQLPAVVFFLLPVGMLIGIAIYAVLFVHFISPLTLLGGAFLPFFGFALFAPLPAILFTVIEMQAHLEQYRARVAELFPNPDTRLARLFRPLWHTNPAYYALTLALIGLIQAGLIAAGQPLLALYYAFYRSEGFLFSQSGWDIF